jgi:hypothetical protein
LDGSFGIGSHQRLFIGDLDEAVFSVDGVVNYAEEINASPGPMTVSAVNGKRRIRDRRERNMHP